MTDIDTARLRSLIARIIGPAPWYCKTFPTIHSASGQRFSWTDQGQDGALAHIVSLALEHEPAKPRLALNRYCRPFLMPPSRLGVWCPEGRNIRLVCFDPDQLEEFDFNEIAGWFRQSADRIYAATAPLTEFEVSSQLSPGMNQIEVPQEMRAEEELIVPATYPAKSSEDPAMALFVFYLHAGLVEVLPQKWFTAAQYNIDSQGIIRAARDAESHRIIGDGIGMSNFLLREDGCSLDRWL
jgi:hypothetical protein